MWIAVLLRYQEQRGALCPAEAWIAEAPAASAHAYAWHGSGILVRVRTAPPPQRQRPQRAVLARCCGFGIGARGPRGKRMARGTVLQCVASVLAAPAWTRVKNGTSLVLSPRYSGRDGGVGPLGRISGIMWRRSASLSTPWCSVSDVVARAACAAAPRVVAVQRGGVRPPAPLGFMPALCGLV